MKRIFRYAGLALGILLLIQVGVIALHRLHTSGDSRVHETEHFSIHYRDVSSLEIERLAKRLDRQFLQTTRNLRSPEHPRVIVHVHPTQEDLVREMGFFAMGGIKGVDTVHVTQLPIPFRWLYPLEEVARHEFVHTVTLNILLQEAFARGRIEKAEDFDWRYGGAEGKRFDQVYPRWLWEGLATYEAGQYNMLTMSLSVKDGFPTLRDLNGEHNQIYHVGYTLVAFILHQWGSESLRELIATDGDIQGVLGIAEHQFAQQWERYVRENYRLLPL
jgi:hypothetical protein